MGTIRTGWPLDSQKLYWVEGHPTWRNSLGIDPRNTLCFEFQNQYLFESSKNLVFAFNFLVQSSFESQKSQSDIPMIKNIVSPVFPIIFVSRDSPIIDGKIKCPAPTFGLSSAKERCWLPCKAQTGPGMAEILAIQQFAIENSNLDSRFTNIRWCSMVFCKRLPEGSQTGFFMDIWWDWQSSSGWWFQPLWKILVKWDYCSQYMEK